MPTSCITGSVCSAAPLQSQCWMSGDGACCQPHSPGSGPLQRDVQCLAGAKGSQHTQLYQPPLPGNSAGAAELWEQPALLGSFSWPPKREGLDQGAAPGGMLLAKLCPQPHPLLFVSSLLRRAHTSPLLNFSDLSGTRKQLLLVLHPASERYLS